VASPFRIEGPAVVSFSGGRTSGYMLRRILDEGLQPDVHVVFADTGREREETYAFVEACMYAWGVPIHRVQRGPAADPFRVLILGRKYLPNPTMRFCTEELKIRTIRDFMRRRGYDWWTNVVGLRADEMRRVSRLRNAKRSEPWDIALPLADADVTKAEVRAFWARQPFDLHLQEWEGNCDLCFLKGQSKRRRVLRDYPDLASKWVEDEDAIGATYRIDAPSYAALLRQVQRQPEFDFDPPAVDLDDLGDCLCTD
jgi:3'-phosphoadenosine 5'-phosphosulfate sulfotransferase (PAPS reductase)/FAD synthetase